MVVFQRLYHSTPRLCLHFSYISPAKKSTALHLVDGQQLKISLVGNTGTFTIMLINVQCPENKIKNKNKSTDSNAKVPAAYETSLVINKNFNNKMLIKLLKYCPLKQATSVSFLLAPCKYWYVLFC